MGSKLEKAVVAKAIGRRTIHREACQDEYQRLKGVAIVANLQLLEPPAESGMGQILAIPSR
jgi:hypothetical protein